MCKHKSGGMSKSSGDSSQEQQQQPERPAPQSSHPCPQCTSETSVSSADQHASSIQAPNFNNSCDTFPFLQRTNNCDLMKNCPGIVSQTKYEPMSNAQEPDYKKSFPQVSNDRHSVYHQQATYPYASKAQQQGMQSNYQDQAFYHYLPSAQQTEIAYNQQVGYPSFDKNQQGYLDSDEETEQSPMLVQQQYKQAWNPNIVQEETFNILPPSPFATPYPRPGSDEASNCDNYPHYKIQNTFQEPVSYTPVQDYSNSHADYFSEFEGSPVADLRRHSVSKKKWFLSHKCKSADSEPDSGYSSACRSGLSLISYNYVQGPNSLGTRTYSKPLFANNGDPIAGPSGLQRPCSINWEIGGVPEDTEFRSRSYSLTPTVNFAVFESESSSDTEDICRVKLPPEDIVVSLKSSELQVKTIDDLFDMSGKGGGLPVSPSAAQLSIASSYGDNGSNICKICHTTGKEDDPLISPCRCSGTMQFIHCTCLMRWLEVCNKRGKRPASCELCQYEYHWHKKFKIGHWQWPHCSRKDTILHVLFVFSIVLMVTCAALTVVLFKQDNMGTRIALHRTELTHTEIGNLVCGVLFFVAFFVAIYVEAKSQCTLYRLIVRFIRINQQWYIDEYDNKKETPPVAV